MLSSVRFSSASLSRQVVRPSTASKECQTLPIHFSSIGTDPIRAPEKGTQTESQKHQQQRINTNAEDKIRISTEMVDLIMGELKRAETEEELLDAYERKMAFEEGKVGGRVQLRHICQLEMDELNDHFGHDSIVLTSVHCDPGNSILLLFGFAQHEIWCSGHFGAKILIMATRRGQHGRMSTIPLSTCPSTAEFARYGELVIVGTHSGELLLLCSESGDLLWSSETNSALTHSFTVTQLRWAKDSDGREQQKELISLSLDGTIRKSRLGTDNRLELLQSVTFTLANLPRELRKGAAVEGTKLGLIGCDFDEGGNLHVATETGTILKLDMDGLKLLDAFVLGESPGGVEQFNLIRLDQWTDEWQLRTQIIWQTSDGIIRCCPLSQQKALTKETKILALPHSRGNFQICSEHRILLIIGQNEKGQRELVGWDIEKGEKMALRKWEQGVAEAEGEREPEEIGGRGNFVAVATMDGGARSQKRELALYELAQTNGGSSSKGERIWL